MISGKYVGLRALESDDLQTLRDWRNIPEFRKNFREVNELNMVDQTKWFSHINNSNNDYMFGIVELESNELIGACGLLYINWVIRSADFSFYIGKDNLYVEGDLAKETANLLIDYGFNNLNLHKIWMELYEFDTQKIQFFKDNFSFKQDGILRDNCFEDGRYWNSIIISLLKQDQF